MGKKLWLSIAFVLILGSGDVFANIDNLSNMSSEWIRTGNRNAATDKADAVVYNPGGITELPDGFAINIGNQTLIRKPEHSFTDPFAQAHSYEQDDMDLLLPNFYMTYNKDDWALWGGIYIPGGGAVVDYPDGSFTTVLIGSGIIAGGGGAVTGFTDDYLDAESIYMTYTFGGAYKINEKLSVAAGLRYIDADTSIKAGLNAIVDMGGGPMNVPYKVDVEQSASGTGIIFGLNLNPTDKVNIGLQYQSSVALNFDIDVNKDDVGIFQDGTQTSRDLPAMFGLGVGYDMSEKLYLEADFSYWFQNMADWDTDVAGRDVSSLAGDTFSTGVTGTYKITDAVALSTGVVYTGFKWEDRNAYYEVNQASYEVLFTDNYMLGGGASWQITDIFEVNFGLAQTFWKDGKMSHYSGMTIDTKNATSTIAVGANITF